MDRPALLRRIPPTVLLAYAEELSIMLEHLVERAEQQAANPATKTRGGRKKVHPLLLPLDGALNLHFWIFKISC